MQRHIHISNVDNNNIACFDTGLDPRSFARTKMSQCLIEPGYVVNPDGTHEVWKSAGVNDTNGFMRVWGPMFSGKRLDLLLDNFDSVVTDTTKSKQTALQVVLWWIRAKMFLGDTRSTLNPGAAFVHDGKSPSYQKGAVFFAPEHLSNRCLLIEGTEIDRYNCPDLIGMDASAFCAGVMLYKILTGSHPYPNTDIFQDMREGVFLPVRLAAPELDEKLAALIQAALLLPVERKKASKSGTDILSGFMEILLVDTESTAIDISLLFNTLSVEKTKKAEKEKQRHLFRQNSIVKTKRFAIRNKHLLLGSSIALAFALFLLFSTQRTFSQRPTTAGLSSETVVIAYYESFSSLNHIFMEACIQRGVDRSDINVAATFYAISRTRQAHEAATAPLIISARVWLEQGGTLPARDVFGITELTVERLAGSEADDMVVYRADYLLWSPDEYSRSRTDILTLRRDRRGNWRIIEILRTER